MYISNIYKQYIYIYIYIYINNIYIKGIYIYIFRLNFRLILLKRTISNKSALKVYLKVLFGSFFPLVSTACDSDIHCVTVLNGYIFSDKNKN